MSILIAYASKYGFTKKCADILAEALGEETYICDLDKNHPDLSQYDKIIIGGSVYIGKIRKPVTLFCNENLDILKEKKLGLFICGLAEGDDAKKQMEASFPPELLKAAVSKMSFGGGYEFKKINFLERMMIKKVTGSDKDQLRIEKESIDHFAELIKNA